MIELKQFNEQVVYIGAPGSGKSYLARHEAWARSKDVGGYLIAHDPTGSFDDERKIPHRRHASTEALHRALAKEGGRVAHILETDDADEVLRAAIHVGQASMARAQRGQFAPVLLLVDEAVAVDGAAAHGLTPLWKNAIMRRRHYGIGLYLTAQTAHLAHRTVLTLATRIEVFRIADPADEKRLIAIGLDADIAANLRRMEDRAHVTVERGRVVAVHNAETEQITQRWNASKTRK